MTLRQIDELVTLYELEPTLKEVFTEGRTDSAIIREVLQETGLDIPVYAVCDRVEGSSELMEQLGLTWGNKNELIALAHALSDVPGISDRVVCVIDTDHESAFGVSIPHYECLLRTDYSSIEAYCFNERVVQKYLSLTLRAPSEVQASVILNSIEGPLSILFFVRYVLHNYEESVPVVSKIERRCNFDGEILTVDHSALIRDSILSSDGVTDRNKAQRAAFLAYKSLAPKNPLDRRNLMNGHDFPVLLCLFIARVYPQLFRDDRKDFKNPKTTMAALYGCLNIDALLNEPMFLELVRRLSRTA